MIEIILDFNEIDIKDTDRYNDIEYKLGKYVYKKLNIGPQNLPDEDPNGRGIVWDAFSDNLTDLMHKEIPIDYQYDPNDEWGWSDYQDYQDYVKLDRSIGLKNEEGIRDDIRLVLVNFYEFNYKNRELAQEFLEVITTTYSEYIHLESTEVEEVLKLEILIRS